MLYKYAVPANMMRFLITLSLVALLGATSAFAQEKTAPEPLSSKPNTVDNVDKPVANQKNDTSVQRADDLFEYSDAQECHIKVEGQEKPFSVLHALIASRGMSDKNQDQLLIAIGTTLAHGCDINEPDKAGLQPLNAAILFNDAEAVALLLEKGADPYLPIHKPNSPIDGLNSFDFLKIIKEKEKARQQNGAPPRDFSQVSAALQKYR